MFMDVAQRWTKYGVGRAGTGAEDDHRDLDQKPEKGRMRKYQQKIALAIISDLQPRLSKDNPTFES